MKHLTLAPGYSLHPDGYILVPLKGKNSLNRRAKIDLEDYEKVSKWRWYANQHGYSYGQRSTPERIKLEVFMHHLVLFTPPGKICDHINRDRLDNRKANLRATNYSVNNRNRARRRGRRFKGVAFHDGGWTARIKTNVDGKSVNAYLGYFASEEEAAEAYDSALKGLDAKTYQLNFPERDIPAMSVSDIRRKNGVARFSSPYVGVSWLKRHKKWQAYDTVKRRLVYIGVFTDPKAAARAVDMARVQRGAKPVNFI